MLFSLLQRRGVWGEGGRAGPRMQCQPALLWETLRWEGGDGQGGRGGYTEQLRLQIVLKTGSAQ